MLRILNILLFIELRKLNAKRDSGGIIIYVKSELYNSKMLVKTDCDDIIWLKFEPGVFSENTLY